MDQFRRDVLAFAETSADYLQARLREFPRVLYGAAAVSFLLVGAIWSLPSRRWRPRFGPLLT